jgi:hypothetical protein
MRNFTPPIRIAYLKYKTKLAVRYLLWETIFEMPCNYIKLNEVLNRVRL